MLGTSRVVATLLTSVLLVSPALAQKPPSDKDKAAAQELVKKAITKSQAKDHEAAIELYLKAYALVPLPTLLSNVGTEYQTAKKPVEALKYFCMYLEKDPTGPLSTYATAQAITMQKDLGNTSVDEDSVCKPLTPPVDTTTNTTTGGGDTTTGGGGNTTTGGGGEITAPIGEPVDKGPETADPGSTLKLVGLVGVGLGVGAAAAGFYFGSQAKKISDDISSHTDTTVRWRDDIKDYEAKGQRYENIQIATLIAGGVLVVGGTVLHFVGRSKTASAERMTVTPVATGDTAGVVFSGRF